MSIKIALGGDVNFSKHKGQIANLVQWKKDSRIARYRRKLIKTLWSEVNFYPSRKITGIIANHLYGNNILNRNIRGIFADHFLGNYKATREIKAILLEEYGGGFWKNPLYEINEYNDKNIPFKRIGKFFRNADIGCVNLETPLSKRGRHIGMFCSSPDFAGVLRENNIGIVSLANNHSFDAGERGFIETINVLKDNNIKYFGGGMNIKEARNGEIIEIGKAKLGFLGYTALCNSFFISLARNEQPGILPLFEPVVLDDIRNLKKKCDFLIVAPHFDIENISKIHKNSITIAHKMIDCGADLIIGSHAHVAKPIEIYKGKLIIYCLGRLIFIENIDIWGKSLVAEVILSDSGNYERVRFYPINSDDKNCNSPYIIENEEADKFLLKVKRASEKKFRTPLVLNKHFLEINTFKN